MKIMRNKIISLSLAVLLLPIMSGCGKWLDVQPYDKIAEDDLLSTEEGFIMLLNGIDI